MGNLDFNTLASEDVNSIFLNGDFSQKAIFKSNSLTKEIDIQFFEESLDKMSTVYHHAWTHVDNVPYIIDGDILIVGGVEYGIVDSSSDEHNHGINLFLQEV
jgi:hypothetical protein